MTIKTILVGFVTLILLYVSLRYLSTEDTSIRLFFKFKFLKIDIPCKTAYIPFSENKMDASCISQKASISISVYNIKSSLSNLLW